MSWELLRVPSRCYAFSIAVVLAATGILLPFPFWTVGCEGALWGIRAIFSILIRAG